MKKILITLMVLGMAVSANAWEIHRGAGLTTEGKIRTSSMPYTYDISEGLIPNHYPYAAAGHNPDVGTIDETIWAVSDGNPFISGITSVRFTSSATSDVATTALVTVIDENFNLTTHTATITGQTPVTLAGVSPFRVLKIENNSSADWGGDIYAAGIDASYAAGVPQESSLILGKCLVGWGSSQSAIFTVPTGKSGFITGWWGSTGSNKLTELILMVRPTGKAWKVIRAQHINQDHFVRDFHFPEPVAALTDIQIMGLVTQTGGDLSAGFQLWYED